MGAAESPVVALLTGIAEYQVRVLAGISRALQSRQIPLLVVVNAPFASEGTPTLVLDLLRRRVSRGVIALADASAFESPDLRQALDESETPTVTLGSRWNGAPRILGDNAAGMRDLMRHLLDERRVRRLALIRGRPGQVDADAREEVFRQELARRDLIVDEQLVIDGDFLLNTAYEQMRLLLETGPELDAVVALNDATAFGALAALTDHGLRVPQDVLLSGFDNTEGSSQSWPSLTTVDPSLEEQGVRAVEELLRLIDGGPATDVVVPSQLVIRASTTVDPGSVVASADAERFAELPGVRVVEGEPMMGLPQLTTALGGLALTAQALQARVALQDAALYLSWTTSNCRTMDDVVRDLTPCLNRLRVRRFFLAVDHPPELGPGDRCQQAARADRSPDPGAAGHPGGPDPGAPERTGDGGDADDAGDAAPSGHPSRLALSYRGGRPEPAPLDVFPRHELLPAKLRSELESGVLLLQALSVGGRERGYLLYEPVQGSYLLTEALRIDLPRTIDTVLTSQELQDHAATLERLVARRTRELEQLNAELQRFVVRDGLTGIANRTAFQEALERYTGARSADLAILMIDVDKFKPFNDRYGHLAGDEALRTVASCLTRALRDPQRDVACRYGGEEFAVLMPEATVDEALDVARQFRSLLADVAIPHEASAVASVLTASIGAAASGRSPRHRTEDLLAAADKALYQAKLTGRDRIVVAPRIAATPRSIAAGVRVGIRRSVGALRDAE